MKNSLYITKKVKNIPQKNIPQNIPQNNEAL